MTYVDAIHVDPWGDVLSPDTVVRFRVTSKPGVDLNTLQFRVYQLRSSPQQEWVLIQSWRPWPIPPQLPRFSGPTAFHVDVRAGPNSPIQALWLGNLLIGDLPKQTAPPLLQLLSIGAWAADQPFASQVKALADNLDVAFAALDRRRTEQDAVGAEWFEVAPGVRIDLAHHDHYIAISRRAEAILGTMIDSPMARRALWASLAIAEGFKRASPTTRGFHSLTQANAHCNSMSFVLFALLKRWGIDARCLEILTPPDAGHALVQCTVPTGPLLLDAYAGLIAAGDVHAIRSQDAPAMFSLFYPHQPIFDSITAIRNASSITATSVVTLDQMIVDASTGEVLLSTNLAAAAE